MLDDKKRLYFVWWNARKRCTDKNSKTYEYYGARGITFCREWDDFNKFYSWSISNGYKMGLQLDRTNNSKGYSPSNCRFITRRENMNNMRNNIKITAFGETKNLSEWAYDDRCGVSYVVLWGRYKKCKMSHQEIVSKPKTKSSKYRGVSFHKLTGKYSCHIDCNKKRNHLGEFFTEKAAAAMYNVYAYSLLGDKARLNDLR